MARYEAIVDFQRDYYMQATKASQAISWERRRSQYMKSVFHLNYSRSLARILYTVECGLKVHTMKNFAAALRATKITYHFPSSASRGTT